MNIDLFMKISRTLLFYFFVCDIFIYIFFIIIFYHLLLHHRLQYTSNDYNNQDPYHRRLNHLLHYLHLQYQHLVNLDHLDHHIYLPLLHPHLINLSPLRYHQITHYSLASNLLHLHILHHHLLLFLHYLPILETNSIIKAQLDYQSPNNYHSRHSLLNWKHYQVFMKHYEENSNRQY